jgi:hypothetical protein
MSPLDQIMRAERNYAMNNLDPKVHSPSFFQILNSKMMKKTMSQNLSSSEETIKSLEETPCTEIRC